MFTRRRLLAAALVVAIGWLAVLHSVTVWPELNADASYPLVMAKDIAARGMRGVWWMVPPANGFVPDVAITTLALAFGADGFANFSAFYAAFTVLLFGAGWFFLASAPNSARSLCLAPAVSAAAVSLLVLCGSPLDRLSALYISPDHHQMAMVVTLLALGLYLRPASQRRLAWLAAIIALGTFADPIVVVQTVVPAVVLAALSRSWKHAAASAAGVGTGFGLRGALAWLAPVGYGTDGTHFDRVLSAMRALLAGVPETISIASSVRGWVGVVCLLGLCVTARRSVVARVLALATVIGMLGPGLVGTWNSGHLFRQQLPLFYMPALGCLWLVGELAARRWSRFPFVLAPAALALVLAVNARGFSRLFARDRLLWRQGEVARTLQARGVTAVAATYWAAKPLWLQSRGRLSVCQLNLAGGRLPWIVDVRWCDAFVDRSARAPVVAVVAESPWDPALDRLYGPSRSTETVRGFEIRYYKPAQVLPKLLQRWGR